jgi:hypothetical protein
MKNIIITILKRILGVDHLRNYFASVDNGAPKIL